MNPSNSPLPELLEKKLAPDSAETFERVKGAFSSIHTPHVKGLFDAGYNAAILDLAFIHQALVKLVGAAEHERRMRAVVPEDSADIVRLNRELNEAVARVDDALHELREACEGKPGSGEANL